MGANELTAETGVSAAGTEEMPTTENLRITTGTFVAPGEVAETTDPAVEAALRRDDDLGTLISQALNLPPPPMPAFE